VGHFVDPSSQIITIVRIATTIGLLSQKYKNKNREHYRYLCLEAEDQQLFDSICPAIC